MKILSTQQIYDGYKLTGQALQISYTELMERSGIKIFDWLHRRMQGAQVPIHIFCGIGDNGGNGLVLARHLIIHGYNTHVYIINYSKKRSKDFLINYDRIKDVTKTWPTLLSCQEDFPEIHPKDIIVDAIFGIGLNRPVLDWVKALFVHLKQSNAFTLSVDIPSGLYTDKPTSDVDAVVWANFTLSFEAPKLVFFLSETQKYVSQWEILDLEFDASFLQHVETDAELIGKYSILANYIPRLLFSTKANYGHVLAIGGQYGKVGGVVFALKGALHCGAGAISAYVPKCGYQIVQSAVLETRVITDSNEDYITSIDAKENTANVIVFGINTGVNTKIIEAFKTFLKSNTKPLVIDDEGLLMLSKQPDLLKLLPEIPAVLTPSLEELESLIGSWNNDFEKLEKAKAFSKQYNLVLVLKGAYTTTVFNNKCYINTTGNPGLAKAGTGHALTGIIAGLIAQGYHPLTASIMGVFIHGTSADIALEETSIQGLTANHVIEYLGDAFLELFEQPEEVIEDQEDEE